MGYSSSQCQRIPFDLLKITMFCPFGYVTDVKYLGINPSGILDRDSCVSTKDNAKCNNHIKESFKQSLQDIA